MNVLVIHGPNLHLLGERRPDLYGALTLRALNALLRREAKKLGLALRVFQSNSEGRIIDLLTANRRWARALVINPAAYTHYSYAIRDAIEACGLPAAEVHLTDISKREPFRRVSVTGPACVKTFKGKGPASYLEALRYFAAGK